MKVKVCGLRDPNNIETIVKLGVDMIGLIFYPKSKRYVGGGQLADWLAEHEELFSETEKVGVFVNAEIDTVLNAVHDYGLDYVQLHGDESPSYCTELKLIWGARQSDRAGIIKAFSITPAFDFDAATPYVSTCAHFVFDTGGRGRRGGTGEQWDWRLLQNYTGPTPFLLSGGLGPEDATAVRALRHPQLLGVDLNSRFESEPAVKDPKLLRDFLHALA